jgi:catechol 2,3-dioxygenase-like lactoylglutathione lyase family enzyme
MNLELQLVILPVSDIDAAKAFYVERVGFNADHDHTVSDDLRFVQLTPPGSACSIAFGKGLSQAAPGSVEGLQLVTDDIEATRTELLAKGLDVGDVDPQPWGKFLYFADPDGNRWAIQEIVIPS